MVMDSVFAIDMRLSKAVLTFGAQSAMTTTEIPAPIPSVSTKRTPAIAKRAAVPPCSFARK